MSTTEERIRVGRKESRFKHTGNGKSKPINYTEIRTAKSDGKLMAKS